MQSKLPRRLIKVFPPAWAVACGLYFLWEALSYRGIFSRLAEFQIVRFGHYVPLLTYLFLLCFCTIPVLVIARFLLKDAHAEMPLADIVALRLTQARRLRRLLIASSATALCVAGGFLAYAFFALPDQKGELQTITASEIGNLAVREGPVRLVGGELGTIIFFGQDWLIGDDRMAFSPYRPTTGSDGLARIFVQLEATKKSDAERIVQRPSWSGLIVEGGLPGPVRVLFNYLGVGISTPYYTLYQTEYALKIRYWLQAIQWAILSAFLAILVAFQKRAIARIKDLRDHLPT